MATIPNPITRAVRYGRTHGIGPSVHKAARLAARYATMHDLPMTVHVEVSNVCNLDCEYCVLDQGAQGDRVMRESTFDNVLLYLRNALRINVSGLAEPLMNTRFTAMLAEIRRAAPTAAIQMCTNASLLTEEIAHSLVDSKLDEVAFSLDGVDPQHFDAVRHGASLSGLVENIETLRRVVAERGADRPALTATTVLQRHNIEQFPDVVRMAGKMGVTTINANGLEPYVGDLVDAPLWADPDSVEGLGRILCEAGVAAEQAGIELRMTAMRPQTAVCPQIHRPIILADGAVVPCSVLAYPRNSHLKVDETGAVLRCGGTTPRLSFGNVNERPFKEIWRGAEYARFRNEVSAGAFPEPCRTCLMKHYVICPQPPMSLAECLATLEVSRASR
jgi:radical SAM protein with 4Fe4S-binding SPASM domain